MLAAALILGVGASSCGQNQGAEVQAPAEVQAAANFVTLSEWGALVDGVTVLAQTDNTILVTASPTVQGYQVSQNVSAGSATTMILRYDITVQGGPGYIGVLKGDGSSWLGNFPLEADRRSTGEQTVPVSGDVQIVLQTNQGSPANTTFTLHNVQYALQ